MCTDAQHEHTNQEELFGPACLAVVTRLQRKQLGTVEVEMAREGGEGRVQRVKRVKETRSGEVMVLRKNWRYVRNRTKNEHTVFAQ